MELQQFIDNDERPVRSVTVGDGRAVVADLGSESDGATVDVVGETAIVATGDGEFDVDLPAPAERAFIKNGVLTIELEAAQ